jgi:hypothetical protein
MEFTQPPPQLVETAGYAFWGLSVVRLPGRGAHLCFTVQGVGAHFGPSGGTQFAFTSVDGHAARDDLGRARLCAEFWWRCMAAVGPDGRLGLSIPRSVDDAAMPGPPADLDRECSRVRHVLTGMLRGDRLIAVEGTTDELKWTIGRLLSLLPWREIEARTWWTCALSTKQLGKRAVSGTLPHHFRDIDRYRSLGNYLPDPVMEVAGGNGALDDADIEASLIHAPSAADADALERRAIIEVAGEVARLRPGQRTTVDGQPTLSAVVNLVIDERLTLKVWELIRDVAGRERLRGVLPAVRSEAKTDPHEARSVLVEVGAMELGPALCRELVHAIADAPNRQGSVGGLAPPPYAEPVPGWRAALRDALLCGFGTETPGDPSLAEWVRLLLTDDGRPLAQRDEREGAHDFLADLGLTWSQAIDLFPLRSRLIADRIRDRNIAKPIDDDTWSQLLQEPHPAAELARVAPYLRGRSDDLAYLLRKGVQLAEERELENGRTVRSLLDDLRYNGVISAAGLPRWVHAAVQSARKRGLTGKSWLEVLEHTFDLLAHDKRTIPQDLRLTYLTLLSEDTSRSGGARRALEMTVADVTAAEKAAHRSQAAQQAAPPTQPGPNHATTAGQGPQVPPHRMSQPSQSSGRTDQLPTGTGRPPSSAASTEPQPADEDQRSPYLLRRVIGACVLVVFLVDVAAAMYLLGLVGVLFTLPIGLAFYGGLTWQEPEPHPHAEETRDDTHQ